MSEKLVWHYTDAGALSSIITTGRLRASSAAYMNDPGEIEFGQQLLSEHFKLRQDELQAWQVDQLKFAGITRRTSPESQFLLCAATKGDLLTLWRYYGVESVSYSIGLDRSVPLVPVPQVADEKHPHPPPDFYEDAHIDLGNGDYDYVDPDHDYVRGGDWRRVRYLLSPLDARVKKHFDDTVAMFEEPKDDRRRVSFVLLDFVGAETNFWKDAGFKDEREVRATWWVQPNWKYVKFRAGRFGLVPYVEVSQGPAEGSLAHGTKTELPIRAITIGPTPFAQQARRALEMLLEINGYGGVDIRQSVTPFR